MSTKWPETLLLVRHGESEGNVADRTAHETGAGRIELPCRDADVALSATGTEQARALGRRLRELPPGQEPTVVLSSPYQRAVATARTAVAASGLRLDVRLDERLRERELGVLDGFTGLGIREHFPEESERRSVIGKFYYRPPGGESWCDVALRVRSMVASLRTEYAGERVLLTSHQAVIMVFRYVLESLTEAEILDIDRSERIANCSLTWYAAGASGFGLRGFNDAQHVAESGAAVTEEPAKESLESTPRTEKETDEQPLGA
jgi:probable phosphoglycerate mutase